MRVRPPSAREPTLTLDMLRELLMRALRLEDMASGCVQEDAEDEDEPQVMRRGESSPRSEAAGGERAFL